MPVRFRYDYEDAHAIELHSCPNTCAVHIIILDSTNKCFAAGGLSREAAAVMGERLMRIGRGEDPHQVCLADETAGLPH